MFIKQNAFKNVICKMADILPSLDLNVLPS